MQNNLEKIFDFLKAIEKLKSTLRYSKTSSGRQESSAEHSWRLALLVPIIAKEYNLDINAEQCIKLALVHDLPKQ